jgi:ferredoxin-NADP reductase
MTAPLLLTCIIGVLLIQVVVGVVVWWQRLPPAAIPSTSIEMPVATGAWSGWRDFRVVRREFEDRLQDKCSFYLEPVDGTALKPFLPGQYLTLLLKASRGDSAVAQTSPLIRCYSLSDRPSPTCYRITVKRIAASGDSPNCAPGIASNFLHDHVNVGDVVQVKAPTGHFHLETDATLPLAFVAGGIGATPLISMALWCAAEQPKREMHFYYGLRNGADMAFRTALDELVRTNPHFHLHVAYSQPAAEDQPGVDYEHLGHLNLELLRRTLPRGRYLFYVCGPAPMMQTMVPALIEWGVANSDIHFEAFGPSSLGAAQHAMTVQPELLLDPVEVQFRRSGRTLQWRLAEGTLLQFAERHGIAVESGCRAGSCGACQTPLLAGKVQYVTAPDFEISAGHCLLCVGRPAGPVALEA